MEGWRTRQNSGTLQCEEMVKRILDATLASIRADISHEMNAEKADRFVTAIRVQVLKEIREEGLWADELEDANGGSLENLLDLYIAEKPSLPLVRPLIADSPPVTPIENPWRMKRHCDPTPYRRKTVVS
ncbi:hypothetical protein PSACC_00519 [Paramicrosporidium saccamoebae]|uniref:Uncharacterized protein n=1 Tax=Paramicrosporidium saccamoebae TaxID=1246581 RepID=A0A2H9TPL9_9FUNG|nr:hypothetical protein PSACC_00519 [Paramicrosporidium saccamoebae]